MEQLWDDKAGEEENHRSNVTAEVLLSTWAGHRTEYVGAQWTLPTACLLWSPRCALQQKQQRLQRAQDFPATGIKLSFAWYWTGAASAQKKGAQMPAGHWSWLLVPFQRSHQGEKDPNAITYNNIMLCSVLGNPFGPPSVVLFCLLWCDAKWWVTSERQPSPGTAQAHMPARKLHCRSPLCLFLLAIAEW